MRGATPKEINTIPDSEIKKHSFWCLCEGCVSNPRSGHLKRTWRKGQRESAQRRSSGGVKSSSD